MAKSRHASQPEGNGNNNKTKTNNNNNTTIKTKSDGNLSVFAFFLVNLFVKRQPFTQKSKLNKPHVQKGSFALFVRTSVY